MNSVIAFVIQLLGSLIPFLNLYTEKFKIKDRLAVVQQAVKELPELKEQTDKFVRELKVALKDKKVSVQEALSLLGRLEKVTKEAFDVYEILKKLK